MTPDDKLSMFLSLDRHARDPSFEAAVALRVARRRALATVGASVPWAIAATALLWGLQPVMGPFGESLGLAIGSATGVLGLGLATAIGGLWLNARGMRLSRRA
jgi:hypothetical protein